MRLRALLVASALTFGIAAADRIVPIVQADAVTLEWTAPGDDGAVGTATAYDVRYSTSAITAANFGSAVQWSPVMAPRVAGTLDTTRVTGLQPSTTYYFALKAVDESGNWSGISNVIFWTTGPPPDVTPPGAPTNLHVKP